MIDEIHVKNLALIEEASLEPHQAMTVITGETGAGKSALLSALKLLIGGRADASAVREGSDACVVQARFFGSDCSNEGVVVSRRVSLDGRNRANLDGAPVSVSELAQFTDHTIDLCGQHEHQKLFKSHEQMMLLDAWGGKELQALRDAYRTAWKAAKDTQNEYERLQALQQESHEKLDEAHFVLSRIEEIAPYPGEYEGLLEQIPLFENVESLTRASRGIYELLSSDAGVLDSLSQAVALLEPLSSLDERLKNTLQSLQDSLYTLEDVSRDMRSYADSVEYNPDELANMQDRIAALQGLMRSYGPRMEDVFERQENLRATLELTEGSQERLKHAERARNQAEKALIQAAEELQGARRDLAPKFSEAVSAQMTRLEMGSATLEVEISELERKDWTSDGSEKIEFRFRAGSGMQARPLARIASGGEISRVMLAIKSLLGKADQTETLIFDEIDAGVGGTAARALAEVLSDVAQDHQVIVVTHLPQVAVVADRHYLIEKIEETPGIPVSRLSELTGEERIKEVARMLSGDTDAVSLEHARELLAKF